MTLTRDQWKILGKVLLTSAGPDYAAKLRARALETNDPEERERLLGWARRVERGASSPEETVEAIEALHDLLFPPPRKRTTAKRKSKP